MKRLILLFAVTFVLSLFAKDTEVDFVLNWKPEQEFGGFYAADILGHFKNENLKVKIIEGGTTTPVVQLIANKKANFGIVSGDELILARDRKMDLVAIYNIYQTSPIIMMSHKSRGAKTLQEAFNKGGTVALEKGLPYYKFFEKHLDLSKMKVVPYAGGIQQFLNDKTFMQQGFITSEPISAKKAGADVQSFLISDIGFDPYQEVVAVERSYYNANKETVHKFVKAIHKGWQDYLDNNEASKKVNEHMHKLNPTMDVATLEAGAKAQIPLIRTKKAKLGTMTEQRWTEIANQLKELKLIKNAAPGKDYFIPFN